MDKFKEFSKIKQEQANLQKQLKPILEPAFRERIQRLFDENPDLTSVAWNQYTPYFNDGDACVFGASVEYCYINGFDEYGDPDINHDDGEDQSETAQKVSEALRKKVVSALCEFDDEHYESMFGDHVQVLIERCGKGFEIETNDYDHS